MIEELSGRTRFTAIFGHPVGHSMSPAMHNAAYAALRVNRAYVAFDVAPDELEAAVRAIPALGLLGVNLTVPHKVHAVEMCDRLSRESRMMGAINCIANRGGKLHGDNTDARGLEADLRELKVGLKGRLAVVIGAGGGAAAAVVASSRVGAARTVIVNRTESRAQALARRFASLRKGGIECRGLDALADSSLLRQAALIINATSMGLSLNRFVPLDYRSTPPDCFFYDLLYAQRPTSFCKPAADLSRPTADGAGMLLYQGVRAFQFFNRIQAPVNAMRRALYEGLGRPLPG